MLENETFDEKLTLKILNDLFPNFETIFESDLNFIKSAKIEQKVKYSLPKLINLANRKSSKVDEIVSKIFPNKYFDHVEPLIWKSKIGKCERNICSYFKDKNISEDIILYLQDGKVRYKFGSKSEIIEIPELHDFFKEKLRGNLEIKMSQLLGIGGESVVLRKMVEIEENHEQITKKECALRISTFENSSKIKNVHVYNFHEIYNSVKVKELEIKELKHENIIKYYDHSFEVIEGILCHIKTTPFCRVRKSQNVKKPSDFKNKNYSSYF